jgi:uncharacterized protein
MTFETWFSALRPEIPLPSAHAVIKLVGEEATLPFIARYRKEQTGNLDEVKIQQVIDAKEEWEKILTRQAFILEQIEKQGKLTAELKQSIDSTFNLDILEDLYLPYKQKRKTKATLAKEAGLEPLADWLWNIGHGTEAPQPGQTLDLWAFTFRNEEKGFNDAAAAIEGAQAILIERISEKQELRSLVRKTVFEQGKVSTGKAKKAKPNSKYENYFDFHEKLETLLQPQNSHRYLAARRGWIEEELTLGVDFHGVAEPGAPGPEKDLENAFRADAVTDTTYPDIAKVLTNCADLALKAHVYPAIENEGHKALKDVADQQAIQVFADNLRKLLLASPYGPKAVLGVDPGIRTGCKIAVVDDTGKYVANTVMFLQSDDQKQKAKLLINEVIKNGNIRAIAVGNGTAGRETEIFLRQVIKESDFGIPVVMISEAGASVYSASEVARNEFPDLDITVRGAISIARRLQDPLAELIKVDPKSIGVGQYQHDVSQPALKRSLDIVVDSCVNSVGVNLNTASHLLLAHVSGIGESLAKAIVEYRSTKGLFKNRTDLLEVSRFSQKTFEQAAGFLRIADGENPLDNTGVHPERYGLLERLATRLGKSVRDLMGAGVEIVKKDPELKAEAGEFTFADIVEELSKPGRDPREEFVPFAFREDIHELKDLTPGMTCPGLVTNVTAFGAFVDIGVHQDGLVHLSQLADRYVKDAAEVVSPGDRVQVRVLEVNLDKKQISLSMKTGSGERQARAERGDASANGERAPRGARPERSRRPEKKQVFGPPGPSPVKPQTPGQAAAVAARGARPQGPPASVKPKQAFNNAFAGLAALKDQLKK